MDKIVDFIEANKGRFLNELFELLKIPSISAKPEEEQSMKLAAEKVGELLIAVGAENMQVIETEGWPVVFAEKMIDEYLPTILVYGHYDVQPAEPYELWDSHPFEPEIRDGKIYARGADDDKGQLFMHVKAFEFMVREKKLPCNVKFVIEGEEEIGSPNFGKFCYENKDLLRADVILLSDTTFMGLDKPTMNNGLRGIAYFEIELKGPDRDLHSGLYGAAINNPCNALARLLATMQDNNGKVLIPGFYDHVAELSVEERRLLNENEFSEEEFASSLKLEKSWGEPGYTTLERIGVRPSFDINGIWGGYTNPGVKTIIPSIATAKISMRLVPDQQPEYIEKVLFEHIRKNVPEGISYTVKCLQKGNPYILPWESDEAQAAIKAMEKTLGRKPLPTRSGGSIPVISIMEKTLGIKSVLLGFGLDSDAIHSPNENYPLENFYKGIETVSWFFHFYTS